MQYASPSVVACSPALVQASLASASASSGDWPGAEADFRKALELEPGQPLVLNYLGYSMVEKQENLDEALGTLAEVSEGS